MTQPPPPDLRSIDVAKRLAVEFDIHHREALAYVRRTFGVLAEMLGDMHEGQRMSIRALGYWEVRRKRGKVRMIKHAGTGELVEATYKPNLRFMAATPLRARVRGREQKQA